MPGCRQRWQKQRWPTALGGMAARPKWNRNVLRRSAFDSRSCANTGSATRKAEVRLLCLAHERAARDVIEQLCVRCVRLMERAVTLRRWKYALDDVRVGRACVLWPQPAIAHGHAQVVQGFPQVTHVLTLRPQEGHTCSGASGSVAAASDVAGKYAPTADAFLLARRLKNYIQMYLRLEASDCSKVGDSFTRNCSKDRCLELQEPSSCTQNSAQCTVGHCLQQNSTSPALFRPVCGILSPKKLGQF